MNKLISICTLTMTMTLTLTSFGCDAPADSEPTNEQFEPFEELQQEILDAYLEEAEVQPGPGADGDTDVAPPHALGVESDPKAGPGSQIPSAPRMLYCHKLCTDLRGVVFEVCEAEQDAGRVSNFVNCADVATDAYNDCMDGCGG